MPDGLRPAGTIAPALSIVVPLYNKATDVGRAIRSLRGQSRSDWEAVVVDDGSTDGGGEVVEALADARVRLVRQPNAGVAAARNTGIRLASSRFIAFLDADDEWDADMVATLIGLRERFPAAQVFATGYRIRRAATPARDARVRGLPPGFRSGILEDYFHVAARSDPPLWTSAVGVEREALLAVDGFPVGVAAGEDLLTWARLAARYTIAYERAPHATFWEPAGTGTRPGRRPAEPDVVGEALAMLDSPGSDHYLAHWHRMRGVWYLDLFEAGAARRELWRAVRLDPASAVLWGLLAVACLPPRTAHGLYVGYKTRQAHRNVARAARL